MTGDYSLGAPLTMSAVITSRGGASAMSVSCLGAAWGMVGSADGVLYGRAATRADLPMACLETAWWQARRRDMVNGGELKAAASVDVECLERRNGQKLNRFDPRVMGETK